MATLGALTVRLRCQSCGETTGLDMRTTSRPMPGALLVKLTLDRDSDAWMRLFVRSHRGPFGQAGV